MFKTENNFKLFFEEYFEPVYRFAKKFVVENSIARDIAQDAFIKLYERRNDFEVKEKAKSFLYLITKNLCIDFIKHQKIIKEYEEEYQLEEKINHSFLHEIVYQETLQSLKIAILKLPPQTQNIIQIALQGKNNNEIADELSISVNTVKSLKKSAYKFIRENMGDYYAFILILLMN